MAAEKKGGNLPPVLYVQLDNCWRENKNTTMFGYLSWLVHMRYFLKICVGFLPVGYVDPQCNRRMRSLLSALTGNPGCRALACLNAVLSQYVRGVLLGRVRRGTVWPSASGGCTWCCPHFTGNPDCRTLSKARFFNKT